MTLRTSLRNGLTFAALFALWPAHAGAAAPPEVTLLARRALIEIGLPPVRPTPAESVLALMPHPWPGVAMIYTVAGTAVPVVILSSQISGGIGSPGRVIGFTMLVFTPSVGHVYGGVPRNALVGLGLRGAGYGLLAASSGGFSDVPNEGAVLLTLAGAALLVTGAVWDVFTVASRVERRNLSMAEARLRLAVGLAPGSRAPALVACFTF